MKHLVWALMCVGYLSMFGVARADDTQVGAAILFVNGTHDEQHASTTGVSVPAPVLFAEHRSKRWDIYAQGIVPFGPQSVGNGSYGLHSTTLSYFGASAQYALTRNTAIGLGETLYNQRSLYQEPGYTENDTSRLAGAQYQVIQTLRRSRSGSVDLTVGYNPHMTANLYQTQSFSSLVDSAPESGTQLDTTLRALHRHGRLTLYYGVRYLDLTMHFPNGQLADQNRFVMPFVGTFI